MRARIMVGLVVITMLLATQTFAASCDMDDRKVCEVDTYDVEKLEAGDTFVISDGMRFAAACRNGCTLELPDGTSVSVGQMEDVLILEGEFVIAE